MATLPSYLGGGLSSIAVTAPVTLSPPSILDRWVGTPHVSPVSSAACFGACFLSVSVCLPPLPFSPGRPSPACWVISCQLGPISHLFSLPIEEDTDRNLKIFFFLRSCMTARFPIMAKDSRSGTEHSAVATKAVGVSTPLLIT